MKLKIVPGPASFPLLWSAAMVRFLLKILDGTGLWSVWCYGSSQHSRTPFHLLGCSFSHFSPHVEQTRRPIAASDSWPSRAGRATSPAACYFYPHFNTYAAVGARKQFFVDHFGTSCSVCLLFPVGLCLQLCWRAGRFQKSVSLMRNVTPSNSLFI